MLSSKPSPVKAALSPEAEEVPVLSPEAAEEVPALQAARLKASAAASREAVSFFMVGSSCFGVLFGDGARSGRGRGSRAAGRAHSHAGLFAGRAGLHGGPSL